MRLLSLHKMMPACAILLAAVLAIEEPAMAASSALRVARYLQQNASQALQEQMYRVQVFDENEQPVPNAEVRLKKREAATSTDAKGLVQIAAQAGEHLRIY